MSEAVFFFGGYQASQIDIGAWLRTAKMQKPSVQFIGFPYPQGAAASDASAVKAFGQTNSYGSLLQDIQLNAADTIYIVGHSSGCAIANAVDDGLRDHKRIVLVALDGYRPGNHQLARANTQVWGAECDGVHSINYPDSSVRGRRIHTATDCKTKWALHFSLVNGNANDQTVHGISTGYANCQANLSFLSGP